MRKFKGISPLVRSISVFSAVAIVAGAVTYAALQSQATLSDNTISSTTAALQINNTDNGGGYGSTDAGFQFTNLVPGGDYSPAKHFKLKNNGGSNLQVSVFATGSTDSGTLDKSKVHVKFTNTSLSTPASVVYTLAQLQEDQNGMIGMAPGGVDFLDNMGEENAIDVQVKIDSDAVSGSTTASSANFNLVFTGTAYQPVETPAPVNNPED